MRTIPTTQREGAEERVPAVVQPVDAFMDCPVYYVTERGAIPWPHAFYCARVFAWTVLDQLDRIMVAHGCGIAHIGCYNPRMARKKNGQPIYPRRWSNHAYGTALDFRGIVTKKGSYIGYNRMDEALIAEIDAKCRQAIEAEGRKPEIVDEGNWLHIGLWTEHKV